MKFIQRICGVKANRITACFLLSILFLISTTASPVGIKHSNISPNILRKSEKESWDHRYGAKNSYIYGKNPAKFLANNYDFIPAGSKVLDVGMGEGRNAVFLASKGHYVTGIDISPVGIRKAKLLAREFGVRIKALESDINKAQFPKESFDAIILFYYLNRNALEKLMSWLKPGGILVVENFTIKQNSLQGVEDINPDFLLREQELPKLVKGARLLKYEEPVHRPPFTASAIFQKTGDLIKASL